MESLVTIFLTPIKLSILEPQLSLGLSLWLSSDRFLKYEIPLDLAATKNITRNSSIALLLYFVGQLILFKFFETFH